MMLKVKTWMRELRRKQKPAPLKGPSLVEKKLSSNLGWFGNKKLSKIAADPVLTFLSCLRCHPEPLAPFLMNAAFEICGRYLRRTWKCYLSACSDYSGQPLSSQSLRLLPFHMFHILYPFAFIWFEIHVHHQLASL